MASTALLPGQDLPTGAPPQEAPPAPVVVLISTGHGAQLSCLGTPGVRTPRFDALAQAGTLFPHAYAASPWPALPDAAVTLAADDPATAYAQAGDIFATAGFRLAHVRLAAEPGFANARPEVRAEEVEVPGWWPDLPGYRRRWAQYLNRVQCWDALAGAVLDALERSPIAETATVFYTSVTGLESARPLHEEALHVPLLAAGPAWPVHTRRPGLTMNTAPTLEPAEYGRAHTAKSACVFDARWRYIRHREPGLRPEVERELDAARDRFPQHWRAAQASLPAEEFYDRAADPWELRNLAFDGAYAAERARWAKLVTFAER